MMPTRPPTFYNITPVNLAGLTVVDLGEMDEGSSEVASIRHSSLPPVTETPLQTRTQHDNIRQRKHRSQSTFTGTPIPSVERDDETDHGNDSADSESVSETQPEPTLSTGDNLAMVSCHDRFAFSVRYNTYIVWEPGQC
jgi:hypothetical protein